MRDDAAIRRVFFPRTIDALLADPGWFVEGRGDQWLIYRLSERVASRRIAAFLDHAIALIERLAGRAEGVRTEESSCIALSC
ncbi:MAG: hypothetical protein JZU52_20025 [Lamprocystis purpurea]|uniref:hypothetical protein n=1 Tax=Lamprocystis purpurea TaxID=61598 RepID=UPI0003675F68|nr:hypothetical protein [Lamprocystis purpurea]MBV5275823.1 hypothetical protein [Lamprocystis purpurea]